MNIIYFNTHDSGKYLSPYGYRVPSPNIDAFARDSIVFRKAFCAAPTCSPSRGALLTGRYPHNNGLVGLSHRGFSLNDYREHLGVHLKKFGYKTVLAGIEHIANVGLLDIHHVDYDVLPYDEVLGPSGTDTDIANAHAVADYIREYDPSLGNFFLSFGLWSTHREYPEEITEGYEPDYLQVPSTIKDVSGNREDFAHYCTSVKIADESFSIVMNALKQKGIYEDTIIIVTTDHGLPTPFMKATLTDQGIGVALIVRVPGSPLNGCVTEALVSQLDVFPTICDLIQAEKPSMLQGISQKPVIMGDMDTVRDHIFAETNYHVSYEPMRCVRTNDYKYIKVFHDYDKPMLANIDGSNPKSFLIDHGFRKYKVDKEYLYDLNIDPNERENLVHIERYRNVLNEMRELLAQNMIDTYDTVGEGEFNHPAGIVLNDPESLEPKDDYFITG